MPVKNTGVEEVPVSAVTLNDYNANEEDGATFERLKEELKENGMIDLPVLLRQNGSLRYIAGSHRGRAWAELGNMTMPAVILEVVGKWTAEDEFNLVNNLNTIRGNTTMTAVKRVIRAQELDVTKLNLFKFPVASLLPNPTASMMGDSAQRKARIRDLALKFAGKIAETILDNMDVVCVAFVVEDKLAAVVQLDVSGSTIRQNAPILKAAILRALAEELNAAGAEE